MPGMASRAWPKNSRHTVRVCCGHAMQDPARGRDQAVAALLLHAGQAAQKLVGHVLAEPHLAETARPGCRGVRCAGRAPRPAGCVPSFQTSSNWRPCDVVDLAEVVVEARDLEPVALADRPCATRPDCRPPFPTAPPSCRRRSWRCCRRRRRRPPRSDRPQIPSRPFGRFADALGDDAGLGEDGRRSAIECPAAHAVSTGAQGLELLGVDDRRPAASTAWRRRCSRCRRRAE